MLIAGDGDIEQVNISLVVKGEDWVGLFNRLQVFRSTQGIDGPFEELTDAAWTSPRIPKDGGDPPSPAVTGPLVNIVGEQLDLFVNDTTLSIEFTGSDPLTYTQVAAQIMSQSSLQLASYVDSDGDLVIEAVYPGLTSQLTVLETDAAAALGLPTIEPDSVAQGRDPWLSLVTGKEIYELVDPFGSREYFYRSRFLNTVTGAHSDYTLSSSPADEVPLAPDHIAMGVLDLVDASGRALRNAEVHLAAEFQSPLIDGKLVAGMGVAKYTDESGHVEFQLVRGQKLTVSVQGTSLVRTITVPTDPTVSIFNLFDPGIADADLFKVSVPEIITAERRTL